MVTLEDFYSQYQLIQILYKLLSSSSSSSSSFAMRLKGMAWDENHCRAGNEGKLALNCPEPPEEAINSDAVPINKAENQMRNVPAALVSLTELRPNLSIRSTLSRTTNH